MQLVSVTVDSHEVKQLFARITARAQNWKVVFEGARAVLGAANAANFAAGGLPSGGWAPLQPQTAAWKVANGMPPVPLIGDGTLMMSLVSLRGPANNIGLTDATFGTNVEYARFHQYGAPRAHLPKRQIVFDPPGFAQLLAVAGAEHLTPSTPLADLKRLFT